MTIVLPEWFLSVGVFLLAVHAGAVWVKVILQKRRDDRAWEEYLRSGHGGAK